ncbi:serine hydrolase [Nocardia sp. NBC_00508]|uniref:serine hydrolase n=1 Tax=Nocardia sp. NBC_00508 TaxID=2975992 RepID=UPI002E8182BE|nr:serine hydrolase [Nocardia sp. NBC_00508]WUD70186.1 serine hydrolase [Nocardia sp. NBC_00508]
MATAIVLAATGCGDDSDSAPGNGTLSSSAAMPDQVAGVPIPDGRIDDAVAELDRLAEDLLDSSGVPGMAVAVVHGGKVVYSRGFGVRNVVTEEKVDPDTVFQLASVSKPVGATVVARRIAAGGVEWDTPVRRLLPSFALADPYVTDHVTIGDLYAHRSGLPDHAGDLLEDLGYDRQQVLDRLRLLPLGAFRDSYEYTNFGVTAAAVAVASAAGTDWETLSEQTIYDPLGMDSTSSRYADFTARANRAQGHVLVDGKYAVANPPRQPDAQSPAGGVSSSVADMAKWMAMVLANGSAGGSVLVPPEDLLPAISPQAVSAPPKTPDARAGFYGFGFNVSNSAAGRVVLGHSGAFGLGAGTAFTLIPSADVGIVTLTNAAPIGVPETLNAEFADLVQFGKIQQDWRTLYRTAFQPLSAPTGALSGEQPPSDPVPARPLPSYAGTYDNAYYGPATVSSTDKSLTLTLGPRNMTFPLKHWNGNTFVFTPPGENANQGTISQATFDGTELTLEYYDTEQLGVFTRR